jgi:hypothetical protein
MPNVGHALDVLARAGETWPGHQGDWGATESGGIRMSPPLGQKPLGQGLSQTEKAISFRKAIRDGVPVAGDAVAQFTKPVFLCRDQLRGNKMNHWQCYTGNALVGTPFTNRLFIQCVTKHRLPSSIICVALPFFRRHPKAIHPLSIGQICLIEAV